MPFPMSAAPELGWYNILSYPPIRVLKKNTLVMIFFEMGFLLVKGYIYIVLPKKTL